MSVEFDTRAFQEMVQGLSQLSGSNSGDVLRLQAGVLMGRCIKDTYAADKDRIRKKVSYRNRNVSVKGGPKLSISKSCSVWFIDDDAKYLLDGPHQKGKRRDGKSVAWSGPRKVPGKAWIQAVVLAKMLEGKRLDYAKVLKSRGLTKATWQQIADSLGVGDSTGAPSWVRGATTWNGRSMPTIGTSKETSSGSSFVIELKNESNLFSKGPGKLFKGSQRGMDGASILQGAMNARCTAFMADLERGVFGDIEQRAKRYKGIFIK